MDRFVQALHRDEATWVSPRAPPTRDDLAALIDSLEFARHLRYLNLSCMGIDAKLGAQLVHRLPMCPNLEEVDLSGNPLGNAVMQGIAAALPDMTRLRALKLAATQIDDVGAVCLAGGLETIPNYQHVGIRGVRAGSRLMSLDLSGNRIGSMGAAAITDALAENEHVPLVELNLSSNRITSRGAAAMNLARCFREKRTLHKVLVSRNYLEREDLVMISDAFRARKLQEAMVDPPKPRALVDPERAIGSVDVGAVAVAYAEENDAGVEVSVAVAVEDADAAASSSYSSDDDDGGDGSSASGRDTPPPKIPGSGPTEFMRAYKDDPNNPGLVLRDALTAKQEKENDDRRTKMQKAPTAPTAPKKVEGGAGAGVVKRPREPNGENDAPAIPKPRKNWADEADDSA